MVQAWRKIKILRFYHQSTTGDFRYFLNGFDIINFIYERYLKNNIGMFFSFCFFVFFQVHCTSLPINVTCRYSREVPFGSAHLLLRALSFAPLQKSQIMDQKYVQSFNAKIQSRSSQSYRIFSQFSFFLNESYHCCSQ